MNMTAEMTYVTMKAISIFLQRFALVAAPDVSQFFLKPSDPALIKLESFSLNDFAGR
jgi:hypothetical protein